MKKQLLSIFVATVAATAAIAQVPSSSWNLNQNATYSTTVANPAVKFMDAVDANVVWTVGMDAANVTRNYNWYSRTTNGGNSFNSGNIFSDTSTFIIANLEGIDANTAWVASFERNSPGGGSGGGAVHKTTNGGASWVNMNATGMFTNTAAFANWVTFFTPSIGIANGDPVNNEYEIWRTIDGGQSWTQIPGTDIPDPLAGEFAIVNLYAKQGTSNLWFGTNGNRMYRSTDAGLTYSVNSVGANPSNTITEIAFSDPLHGICFTSTGGGVVDLWNTNDGGVNWNQISPTPANLGENDISAIPGTGVLVSYGAGTGNEIISYSTDNGLTWTDWGSVAIPYLTGDFVSNTTGWAGSLQFTAGTNTFTNVWKYTGPATSGTVVPTAAFIAPANICLTGGSAVLNPANTSIGAPAPTYSWSVSPAATISSPTASNPSITFSSGNNYTITLMATSATGTNVTSQVVTVLACTSPVANFNLPTAICNKVAFTATANPGGSPAPSYSWSASPAGLTFTPSIFAQSPQIVGAPGTYTLSAAATNISGTDVKTMVVTIPNCAPNLAVNSPSAFCKDDGKFNVVVVNSSTNPPVGSTNSYTWSVAPTGTNISNQSNVTSIVQYSFVVQNTTKDYTVTLKSKNASGTNTLTQVIKSDACTGVSQQNDFMSSLLVYPNPASEQLNISLPASSDSFRISVINVLGSVVYNETVASSTKETSLKMSDKPRGVYFLTVQSGKEKVTKKIIIE